MKLPGAVFPEKPSVGGRLGSDPKSQLSASGFGTSRGLLDGPGARHEESPA